MSARNIGPYTLNRYYRYIGWINCMDTMTQLVCIMFEIAASDHSWIYCWYFFFIIVRESNLYYTSSRGRNITQRYNMSCDSVNIALLLIFRIKIIIIRDENIDRLVTWNVQGPEKDGFHQPKHSHISDILCQSNYHACTPQCSGP